MLHENIALYRGLIENLPDGVVIHHRRKIVHANPAALAMFGAKSIADLKGKGLLEMVHPDYHAKVDDTMKTLSVGDKVSVFDHKMMRLDGTTFWADVHVTAAMVEDVRGVIVVVCDTTAHRRMEEQLRKAQDQLRDAIESMPNGFALWDADDRLVLRNSEFNKQYEALRHAQQQLEDAVESMADGFALWGPDDRLLMVNQPYRKFYGTAQAALLPGAKFEEVMRSFVLHNKSYRAEEVEGHVARRVALHANPGLSYEFALTNGDIYRITERRTREGGIVSICTELTEIRRAEQALRESESLHRLLFDAAPQGIVVAQNGVVVLANQAAARIHGFDSPAAFVGASPHAFIHPEDLARVRQRGATVMANGKERQVEEARLRIVRSDGTICHIMSGAKRFTYRGAPALLIHQLDVTEPMRAEEERRLLESQLRQAQKMKSLGTLAEGIAHEFNNLLVPIIGLTELAIDSLPEGDGAAGMLKQVVSAAQRSRELIKRIHAFSRSEPSPRGETTLVQNVVRATLDLVRPMMPASIHVNCSADSSCGPVTIGDDQLAQILLNLCSNAGDAIGARNGEIAIRVHPARLAEQRDAALHALAPGDYVVLSVRDTGSGMDAATMERIFDPFFTTKEVGQGTGLGLSVTHGIVSARGGGITVSSEPGKGAEFCIYLPVAGAAAATSSYAA